MQKCKCGSDIHPKRIELGYSNCVNCSTEKKKAGIQIINHKTGNEIQIVSEETAFQFNQISSRSSYGVMNGVRSKPANYRIKTQ